MGPGDQNPTWALRNTPDAINLRVTFWEGGRAYVSWHRVRPQSPCGPPALALHPLGLWRLNFGPGHYV
jgi:hypothetical protein